MNSVKLLLIPVFTCLCFILLSQDSLNIVLSETVMNIDSVRHINDLQFGKTTVISEGFNQGIISDPFLLLQGQVSGLQVYNRGGDPNVQSIARIRGVSSLDKDIQPLIVIDGIPNAAIDNIDPNNIASIEVLKNGYAKAQFGARGSNGVIVITTKKHTIDSLLNVQYQGAFGLSNATKDIAILSRDEFIANGGSDLGANNDYLSGVKRTGVSQAHGLSISKGFKNYNYRVSGNYRNTNGILKESGFRQYNGSANLAFNLFDDRLNIKLDGRATRKNQNLSFREVFRYAVTANPTFPVFAKDSPFSANEEIYGGYFEAQGLFASYNPVAMLDLNGRTNAVNSHLYSANISYQLLEDLEIGTNYANQNRELEYSQYGQATSYYLGSTNSGVRTGSGIINSDDKEFIFSDSYLKYNSKISNVGIKLLTGYSYQKFESKSTSFSYTWPDLSNVSEAESRAASNLLISFYSNASFNKNDKLFLDIGLRYDGSSLHAADSKWQFYPSAQIAYDFGGFMDDEEDRLILSGGFGVSGSQYDPFLNSGQGIFTEMYLVEKNSEYDIGVNYSNKYLMFSADLYTRVSRNVNISQIAPFPDPYTSISTRGLDLSLGAKIVDGKIIKYTSNLLLSTYKSTVDFEFKVSYASPGSPGFGSASLLSLGEGGAFGQIYAPVFEGIDSDGFTIYKDVNNDGEIKVFSPGDEDTDYTNVGNAIPDFELSWQHNIEISNFDIGILFRGAFGHSLINLNRMFNENNLLIKGLYNSVSTSKAIEGLNESRYSSLYVEDASFIKLDNLSISRSFQIGSDNRMLSLSLIGQNLLTITGYTGGDPEPSFYDFDGSGYLSPGIDRRASYRPSRMISVGVKFDLN